MTFKFSDELFFGYGKTNPISERDGFDVYLYNGAWQRVAKLSHHATRKLAKAAVKRRNNKPRQVKI